MSLDWVRMRKKGRKGVGPGGPVEGPEESNSGRGKIEWVRPGEAGMRLG